MEQPPASSAPCGGCCVSKQIHQSKWQRTDSKFPQFLLLIGFTSISQNIFPIQKAFADGFSFATLETGTGVVLWGSTTSIPTWNGKEGKPKCSCSFWQPCQKQSFKMSVVNNNLVICCSFKSFKSVSTATKDSSVSASNGLDLNALPFTWYSYSFTWLFSVLPNLSPWLKEVNVSAGLLLSEKLRKAPPSAVSSGRCVISKLQVKMSTQFMDSRLAYD